MLVASASIVMENIYSSSEQVSGLTKKANYNTITKNHIRNFGFWLSLKAAADFLQHAAMKIPLY
jgi:hypothetical protein